MGFLQKSLLLKERRQENKDQQPNSKPGPTLFLGASTMSFWSQPQILRPPFSNVPVHTELPAEHDATEAASNIHLSSCWIATHLPPVHKVMGMKDFGLGLIAHGWSFAKECRSRVWAQLLVLYLLLPFFEQCFSKKSLLQCYTCSHRTSGIEHVWACFAFP